MKKWNLQTYILLAVILIALDQVSKFVIKLSMTLDEAIPVFGEWFYIRFIENPGAAFGFEFGGEWGKLFLTIFRIVAVIFIFIYIRRLAGTRRIKNSFVVGIVFIFAGAVGNIIDSIFYGMIFTDSSYAFPADLVSIFSDDGYGKILHGSVVDMIYFPVIDTNLPSWIPFWGGSRFTFFDPVFNVADSYITCGVIYLILFHRKALKF